jgi:hypothetical protein
LLVDPFGKTIAALESIELIDQNFPFLFPFSSIHLPVAARAYLLLCSFWGFDLAYLRDEDKANLHPVICLWLVVVYVQ